MFDLSHFSHSDLPQRGRRRSMVLEIQSVSGQLLELDVMCGQKIFDVKQLIEGKWGIPPSCQRLLRESEEYSDSYALQEKDLHQDLLCLISLQKLCLQLNSSGSCARAEALQELRRLRGHPAARDAALKCLEDVNAYVRASAVEVILQVAAEGDPEVLEAAEGMLHDQPVLALKLLAALSQGESSGLKRVQSYLTSAETRLRRAAVQALAAADAGRADLFTSMLQDPDRDGFENVRLLALRALQKMSMKEPDVEIHIVPQLSDPNGHIRTAAGEILLSCGRTYRMIKGLLVQLEAAKTPEVRRSLRWVLGEMLLGADDGEKEDIVLVLLRLLQASDPDLQHSAAVLLLPLVGSSEVIGQLNRGPGESQKTCLEIWKVALDWLESTGKEVEVMRLHVPRALQLAGPVANPGYPGALGVLGVAFAIKEPWCLCVPCAVMRACVALPKGTLTICLQLFDLREPPEDVDADLSQLVAPSDGFLLRLQGLPALDKALDRSCERLRLRLDSVETSLDLARSNDSVVYQFPLVDSWEDLNEALSDLHVCLQLEDETSNLEIPLDLSDLIATLGESNGSDDVSVEVRSAPVMSFQGGFPFLATISRNQTAPREAPKDLDIWDRGARLLAVGPRHWRFSIEIRSVRLTERGANVFVSYSYPPLKQPRPFRTNPPNLLRKKATVSMPHSFAAYTLTSNFDDLQAGLEASPLYLEVWHRDLYRKDSVVGIAEADLSIGRSRFVRVMDDEDIEETDFIEDVEEDQEEDNSPDRSVPEGANELEEEEEEEVVEADAALEKYKVCFDESLDKVEFPADTVAEVQQTWQAFLAHAASQEAAGELLFNAWWEAAPSLHSAFVSPQKVLHLRLFLGFNAVVANLGNPSALKIEAEQIAFRHLDRPVKPAFVDIFREAAVEMLEAELTPAHFNTRARVGWQALLNYLGGALCYVSREYSGRVKIILRSWRTANNITEEKEKDPEAEEDEAEEEEKEEEAAEAVTPKKSSSKDLEVTSETGRVSDGINLKERTGKDMKVPTTFKEMFLFNAAVMGFGNSNWMSIILEQFDAMVMNIANSHRLSEECDVLSLVLAKEDEASIHLVEFRSVMLATLRSLCPKDWDTDHE
ncbi:unnamed protein product, partial [Cladocopium goreaui]